ncbi:MAG: hypothetical protein ACXAE3_00345 [Candidatus Kariarchaeaceae archaeon]
MANENKSSLISLPNIIFLVLWIIFALYAIYSSLTLSPSLDDTQLILDMVTGNFDSVDPLVFVIFNLLGVIPLMIGLLVLFDDQSSQRFPAWPFVLASFVSGALGIYLYLISRDFKSRPTAHSKFQQRLNRKYNDVILSILGVVLIGFGLISGSIPAYMVFWRSSSLVNIMTIDFFILISGLSVLIWTDMKHRNWVPLYRFLFLIPFLNFLYFLFRPPLDLEM